MPWWRLDDGLHDHPKVRALLPVTHPLALWLVAGSWCAGSSHEGFIPRAVAVRWVRSPAVVGRLAGALVEVGLWQPGDLNGEPGWWFHNWNARNPSTEEVKARRKADAERQARSRANRALSHRDESVSHTTPALPGPAPSVGSSMTPKRGTTNGPAYPIPDAEEWLTEHRSIQPTPPPKDLRRRPRKDPQG